MNTKPGSDKTPSSSMTIEFVLDSSAILAIVLGEAGRERVAAALLASKVCSVNFAEVITKLIEAGVSFDDAERQAQDLALTVLDFDRDLAMQAGFLRRTTRHKGLSLGDRACLSLAMREKLPVMTADRAWCDLDLPVEVVLIREP